LTEITSRTVFITGCSSGIGRAAALRFARLGHCVVATARKLEDLADLKYEMGVGARFATVQCDVASEESRAAAIAKARETFGPIHILVNNAGFGLFGPVEYLELDDARRQLEVNVLGPMRLVQLVVPDMREAGWGRIINVSSVAGRMVLPFGGWYSGSKFALEALSDALRLELMPFGIETISILPGPVKTKFVDNVEVPIRGREDAPEAYRRMGDAMRREREREAGRRFEISAEDVAGVIAEAARRTKPHPRYVVSGPAWISVVLRKILPDRVWDRLMVSHYGFDTIRD